MTPVTQGMKEGIGCDAKEFELAGDASLLSLQRVKSLLVVPRLVGGLETDGGGVVVERAVPHDEPVVLRPGQLDGTAPLPSPVAMDLTASVPKLRDA